MYVRPGARYESVASPMTRSRFAVGVETVQTPALHEGESPDCLYALQGGPGTH